MRAATALSTVLLVACCGPSYRSAGFADETVVVHGYFYRGGDIEIGDAIRLGFLGDDLCVAGDVPPQLDEVRVMHPVFVVAEGNLSERGHFGHLEGCTRLFRITRLLEFRDLTDEEQSTLRTVEEAERRLYLSGIPVSD